MTKLEWDKLLTEIAASLAHLRESPPRVENGSPGQAHLFERLSAVRAEIESLAKECLKAPAEAPKPQPAEYPDEELRRKWKNPPLTPEFRAWALQDFNEEEFLAGMREIEETGGLEFTDLIHELEQIIEPDQPVVRVLPISATTRDQA